MKNNVMVSKQIIIYLVVLVLVIIGAYYFIGFGNQQQKDDPNAPKQPAGYDIPQGSIHWHPRLKIIIKGEVFHIPDNIGVGDSATDSSIGSDMGAAPIHTHDLAEDPAEETENGRRLHMESLNPQLKPSTLSLWYFFKVWGKTFNSTCIFDKCNGPNGQVKMFVNDKPNTDFDKYFMHDGDRILIVYE